MANGFLGKIGRLFKKPKLKPPTISPGNLGIAAGDIKERARKEEIYRQTRRQEDYPYTEEEMEEWGEIPISEVEGFLAGKNAITVNSSNVASFRWFPETNQCLVEYLNGSAYMYDGCSQHEMENIVYAPSKGGAVWTLFRVRGSRTAHRKAYRRIE